MPGNSSRQGAVRKRGKGTGSGNTAGSGGRVRRGLEGKGPTPKAEDRPYHKAYRKRRSSEPGKTTTGQARGARARRDTPRSGDDWVFGRNPVLEALQAGLPVRRAYVADGVERDDRLRDILKYAADHGIALLAATRTELDKLTNGGVHQGVALQLPSFEYTHADDLLADALDAPEPPLVIACDQITDPRNLGAIIRSAAAFGSGGETIPERRPAQVRAATWKTSAGPAARLPVARVTNLNRTLKQYAEAGFVVAGLAGESELDVSGIPGVDGPVLLVVGSEGDGLSRLVRENCDVLVSIPIGSEVESLNASVAASIALYEVTRCRG